MGRKALLLCCCHPLCLSVALNATYDLRHGITVVGNKSVGYPDLCQGSANTECHTGTSLKEVHTVFPIFIGCVTSDDCMCSQQRVLAPIRLISRGKSQHATTVCAYHARQAFNEDTKHRSLSLHSLKIHQDEGIIMIEWRYWKVGACINFKGTYLSERPGPVKYGILEIILCHTK